MKPGLQPSRATVYMISLFPNDHFARSLPRMGSGGSNGAAYADLAYAVARRKLPRQFFEPGQSSTARACSVDTQAIEDQLASATFHLRDNLDFARDDRGRRFHPARQFSVR